jgi:hypothetical protein
MKSSRLMRVDLEFFKKVEEVSDKQKIPMTEITRQMIPTSSLIRSFNPLEAFSVFKPEPRKKL